MDVFGKRRKRRIVDLEIALANVKRENAELKELLDREKKMACGEKVPGPYCAGCAHGLATLNSYFPFGTGVDYECALMCKCKDFAKK